MSVSVRKENVMQRVDGIVRRREIASHFYGEMFKVIKMIILFLLVFNALSRSTANPLRRDPKDFVLDLNYIIKGDSEPVDEDVSSLSIGYNVFRSNEPDDGLPTNRASKRTLIVSAKKPTASPKHEKRTLAPGYHDNVDDDIMPLEWVSPWYKRNLTTEHMFSNYYD